MPTIPRYNDQQVSSNALPGQRQQVATPIDAFGGQYAEDLGKVAKVVGGVADKAMDLHIRAVEAADKSAVLDALGEADREAQFEGDRLTGEIGKYTGPNAEIKQPFSTTYEQSLSAIYDKPRNRLSPRQQRMYDERAAEIRQRHASKGVDLEIKANNNFMVATATNDIRNSDNEVATYSGADFLTPVVRSADGKSDKTAFDLAVDRLRDSVSVMAGVNGWTKPEEDERVDKAIGVWVAKSAERLIEAGDTLTAGMLLGGKYGDKVDADAKKKITDFQDKKAVENEAYAFVTDAFAKGESLDNALGRVKGEGVKQDAQRKIIKQRFAEKEFVADKNRAQADEEGYRFVVANPGAEIPRDLGRRMNQQTLLGLSERTKTIARGGSVETNWQSYIDARESLRQNPRYPIEKHFGDLGDSEIKELIKLRETLNDPKKSPYFMPLSKRIDERAKASKLSVTDRGRYAQVVNEQIAALYDENGAVSPDEEQLILDTNMLKIKGTFFDTPLFRKGGKAGLEPGDVLIIPDDERRKIEDALTRSGQSVTEDAVRKLFNAKFGF